MDKKKALPIFVGIAVLILAAAIIVLTILVKKYTPTKETADLNEHYAISDDSTAVIIFNHSDYTATCTDVAESDLFATLIDGTVYLDYDFVHDHLNSRFYWDSNENILLYTTADAVVSASTDSSQYTVAKDTEDFGATVVEATSNSALINIDFVLQYSDFTYSYYSDPNRVVIQNDWGDVDVATAKKNTQLRVRGGIKSPIMQELTKGQHLTVIQKDETWSCVMTDDGLIGYVKTKMLAGETTETLSSDYTEETFTHCLKDDSVCLGWNYIGSYYANSNVSSTLSSSKGITVIAPTWFTIKDNEGNVKEIGSTSYVTTCHNEGVEVWATFDNFTNPDCDTTYVLTHTSARQNMVNQILSYAIQYNLDGINLDFETMDPSVGDGYIQFIRELSIKCHNNNLVLSVDNYPPSDYTSFYNRSEQAVFADYIILMAYDEHTSGSEEAGSVADLAWVTESLKATMEEVPANQILLGMPFYTRLWCQSPQAESTDEDSNVQTTLSSQALSMNEQENLVSSKGLDKVWEEDLGQFYVTYQENGNTYEMWLEDAESLEERLLLMEDKELGGCAFWRLGQETSNVWDTVAKFF